MCIGKEDEGEGDRAGGRGASPEYGAPRRLRLAIVGDAVFVRSIRLEALDGRSLYHAAAVQESVWFERTGPHSGLLPLALPGLAGFDDGGIRRRRGAARHG